MKWQIKGSKVIYKEQDATERDFMYILPKKTNVAELIFVGSNGVKTKVGEYIKDEVYGKLDLKADKDAVNIDPILWKAKLGYALASDAYTKASSDLRYQPKGNYALVGASYTKTESDANYAGLKTSILGTADAMHDTLGELEMGLKAVQTSATAIAQKNADQDVEINKMVKKVDADLLYQPKGSYALVGASYTKTESDANYQPKGNYALVSDLATAGKNISNTDLTNPSARIFKQGASFTWDTNSMPYKITGLTDVSNNASFNLTTVIDANGNMGKGDLRQLLLGSFQNLSAGQKTDIASLLNNATTANNHFISGVDNLMLEPNTTKTLLIYGTNLSVIASSSVVLKKGADTITATSWEIVNTQTIKAIFTLPSTLVLGDKYEITIYQGAVKNAGKVELVVANATAYLTPTTWAYVTASGTAPQTSTANGSSFNLKTEANLKALANEALEVQSWFTEKLLLGSKNWQVNIQCASTEINALPTKDFIGISSSDNALQNLVQFGMQFNNNEGWGWTGRQACFRLIGDTSIDGVAQPDTKNCTVLLSKIGSIIYSRVVSNTGRLMGSASATIDTSKNYRIWITKGNSITDTQMQGSIQIIQY